MLKYLDKILERLTYIKEGIELNSSKWEQMPENSVLVQKLIDEIKSKGNEIEQLKHSLSQKYNEARTISRVNHEMIKRLEKRAIGLHAENPDKLEDYGIPKKHNY